MIWDFMGRRPLPVRDHVDSVKDGPHLWNKISKVWRVHVWQNYTEKTDFYLEISIDLVPSHMHSPNFWYFISQVGTVLYRIHMVPDRQGSAAHEIQKIIEYPII